MFWNAPKEAKKFEEESKEEEKKWRYAFNSPPLSDKEKATKLLQKKNADALDRQVKFSYDQEVKRYLTSHHHFHLIEDVDE